MPESPDLLGHAMRTIELARTSIDHQAQAMARVEGRLLAMERDVAKLLHVVIESDTRAIATRTILLENRMDAFSGKLEAMIAEEGDESEDISEVVEIERARSATAIARIKAMAPIGVASLALLSQLVQWLMSR